MPRARYRLHWASAPTPRATLKWAIYDWKLYCPVAYAETRIAGRRICQFLNALWKEQNSPC